MASAKLSSSNFIELHPIQGARTSAGSGAGGVSSVKGRWDQKRSSTMCDAPSKVLVLQATEALQTQTLSHGLDEASGWMVGPHNPLQLFVRVLLVARRQMRRIFLCVVSWWYWGRQGWGSHAGVPEIGPQPCQPQCFLRCWQTQVCIQEDNAGSKRSTTQRQTQSSRR